MAQDDNTPPKLRGPPPGATEPPDHVKQPQIYEIFHSPATPESGHPTSPSEGQPSRPSRPTLRDGVQSIKYEDFFKVHQIPCARDGFLTGIGTGAAVGIVRYTVGAPGPAKAANWAFGAFIIGSILQWEFCQSRRREERAGIARVVEVIDRKQAEKMAQAAEAARLKREAEDKALHASKSWYKFW